MANGMVKKNMWHIKIEEFTLSRGHPVAAFKVRYDTRKLSSLRIGCIGFKIYCTSSSIYLQACMMDPQFGYANRGLRNPLQIAV